MKNCYRLLCEQFQYRGTLRSLSLKLEPVKKEKRKKKEEGKHESKNVNTRGSYFNYPIEFLKRNPLYLGDSIECIGRKEWKRSGHGFPRGLDSTTREIPSACSRFRKTRWPRPRVTSFPKRAHSPRAFYR